MQRFLIAGLVLAAANVYGECYTRSETMSQMISSIEQVADVDRQVLPLKNGDSVCRITFRAYIDGKWYNAEGKDIVKSGHSIDSACSRALNAGRISVLESVSGTRITGNQELICTDAPKIEHKKFVAVGDRVWESEVQPHPVHKNTFSYRGSICKWFIETQPRAGFVEMNQGIICRAPAQKVWSVVDKW